MARLAVGELYYPGKTRWQEGTDFNWRSNTLELRMFFSKLTPSDIEAMKHGACTFYLVVVKGVIFLLFEFGRACPLSDSSYSWWLISEEERTLPPELTGNEQAVLTIILVSAEDGIIRALRQIALGHDFSKALYDAIRAQTQQEFSAKKHDEIIAETYRKYPTSHHLLRIAQATCIVESHIHN